METTTEQNPDLHTTYPPYIVKGCVVAMVTVLRGGAKIAY